MRTQGYRVTVTLSRANYEAVHDLAEATGRTMSAIIDTLIHNEMPTIIRMLEEQRRISDLLQRRRAGARTNQVTADEPKEEVENTEEDHTDADEGDDHEHGRYY